VALLPWSEDEKHPLTANTWQEQKISKKQQFLAILPQAVIVTAINQQAVAMFVETAVAHSIYMSINRPVETIIVETVVPW